MASEDQEILAKISALAGQINRHKSGLTSDLSTDNNPQRGGHVARGYSRGGSAWRPGRGAYSSRGRARGGRLQVHRNKTLVLNSSTTQASKEDTINHNGEQHEIPPAVTTNNSSWISKTDRHRQLINTTVFEKESQNRAKALEETRKQKRKQRDEMEKSKLNKYMRHAATANAGYHVDNRAHKEINVQGIQFQLVNNGNKLIKVPGDANAAKATPKMAVLSGVKFYRSKNGNLIRSGIIKAHRRTGIVKKVNEPCKKFTTTGTCSKGPRCQYVHDPSKVAVCKEFLLRSACPSGDACDLSHDLTPERTPFCVHFAKGNCSNPNCHYAHVRVSPAAPVCTAFGRYGYCDKGSSCSERHVYECPDFSNTGKCTVKGCKLPHKHKASVMRTRSVSVEEDDSDVTSDEEEIDSDDVDSDEFEGELMSDGEADPSLIQQDFIKLS